MQGGGSYSGDADKVRVRYSIVVNYVARFIRLVSGMASSIITTRKLPVEEYGLYGLILSTYNILLYAYGLWDWWMYRYYARDRRSFAHASLMLNILYAPVAVLAYIAIGMYYQSILGFGAEFFLIASSLLAIDAFQQYLRYISSAKRPYVFGYTLTISEIVRVTVLYLLVYVQEMGLAGAIYSLIASRVVALASSYFFLSREGVLVIKPKFLVEEIKIILRNIYIPFLSLVNTMLLQLERHLVVLVTRIVALSAYLTVAYIPRSIILMGKAAYTAGLSAKMLQLPRREDIEDTLRIALILNSLQLTVIVSLYNTILSLLNPVYLSIYMLLILYSIDAYIASILSIFISVMMSIDRSDLAVSGKALARTDIFRGVLINVIRSVAALSAGVTLMYMGLHAGLDTVTALSLLPASWIVSGLAATVYAYKRSRRSIEYSIPMRELASSLVATVAVAAAAHLTGLSSLTIHSFWREAYVAAAALGAVAAMYAAVILALSPWTRRFLLLGLRRLAGRGERGINRRK